MIARTLIRAVSRGRELIFSVQDQRDDLGLRKFSHSPLPSCPQLSDVFAIGPAGLCDAQGESAQRNAHTVNLVDGEQVTFFARTSTTRRRTTAGRRHRLTGQSDTGSVRRASAGHFEMGAWTPAIGEGNEMVDRGSHWHCLRRGSSAVLLRLPFGEMPSRRKPCPSRRFRFGGDNSAV